MTDRFEEKVRGALASLETQKPAFDLVAAAERRALTPDTRRRWPIVWWALPVFAVLAVIVAVTLRSTAPTPPPSPVDTAVIAVSVAGSAWVDDGAKRRTLKQGDRLAHGELVETSEGGRVVLLDHGANVVDVRATTRVYCGSSAEETHVDIERGVLQVSGVDRVSVVLRATNGTERFRLEQGRVGVAVAQGGGSLAVLDGQAFVEDGGGGQTLTQGRQWIFGAARDIARPAELTLAIDRLSDREATHGTLLLTGKTQPGALVTVNGVTASVDAEGAFSVTLSLPRQTARIVVHARDALDRERELAFALREQRSPSPRERRIETRWRWEPTPG